MIYDLLLLIVDHLLRGKTSEQLMDILLDDINHLRRTNMSWLEGRGSSFRVPVYLRYEGQVKNLHIDAKMTTEMIGELLRAKEEGGRQESRMSDFLLQFIKLRYSTVTLQMEFSYNLVDGIDRFKV